MSTALLDLGTPVLTEFSTQIQAEICGDSDIGAEHLDGNVTFNTEGISNMHSGWAAIEPMAQSSADSEELILHSLQDHSPEGALAALCEAATAPPARRDDSSGTVEAEPVEPTPGPEAYDYDLPRRELRPQLREKRNSATTWIDNDDTGDYDPAEEERRERQKRQKVKATAQQRLRRDCVEETCDEEASDQLADDCTPEAVSEPAKLLVSLTFRSQTGKTSFTERLNELVVQENTDKAGYRLRKRSKLPAAHPGSTQGATNGTSTEIYLTAKPFARGCWGCITTGPCSLLHDERQWPCQTCDEDDLDCEPIIPPTRKRACEMCKRRKVSCSYKHTRNHGASCEQCHRVGQRCIAGPVKEFIRPRLSYDRDWEADPLPKRRGGKHKELEDCLECVGARRPCSYPQGPLGSPCEDCTKRGLPCTIASNAPTESASPVDSAAPANEIDSKVGDAGNENLKSSDGNLAVAKPRSIGQVSPATRAAAEAEHHLERPKGTVRKIYTSFSHSITFNCDLEDGQDPSCHFCTEPALPKLGFGLLHPQVVDWSDGRGFEEVRGGHVEVNSIERMRLCYSCTSSRLAIITCYRHRLGDIRPQNAGRAGEGMPSCDVCDGDAIFRCVRIDGDATGCGLKLCKHCAITLSRDHSGYLDKMLGKLADLPQDLGPRTLRADCEFLREDGHMARYLKYLDTQ